MTGALRELRAYPLAYVMLLVLMSGAAWLRLAEPENTSFLIDSAWPLIRVDAMVYEHQFPLLGPRITSGGYLGPAMLYLLAPVALLSNDPEAFTIVIAMANVIAVFIAFLVGRRYFGLRAGLLSALLLGFNLHAVSASRGIWNPFLVPVFSAWLTLLLFRFFVDGAARALVGIALSVSVLLQLHAHTIVLIPYLLLLAWLLPRPRLSRPIVLAALLVPLVTLLLPLLAFDLLNDFYNTSQFVKGWSSLEAATPSMPARTRTFLTMNVFSDRLFRVVFLAGVLVAAVAVLGRRLDPRERAKRWILVLPPVLLFAATVLVARIPLAPRFIQGLVVPCAILCGVTLDHLARRLSARWRPAAVNVAFVIGAMLYVAVVIRAHAHSARDYGFGHLATIRAAAQLVIADSQNRTVARDNVFVCEDGSRALAEYGRSYGYMLKILTEEDGLPARPSPVNYMISAFVQSAEHEIGARDGVHVYRFADLTEFAEFLRGFPDAVCHRAIAETFPYRTG